MNDTVTQQADPQRKRALVAAVQRPSVTDPEFEASLEELRQLAKTLGFEVVGRFTQKRSGFDAAAYFGTGKREELAALRQQERVDVILIDNVKHRLESPILAAALTAEV